jgi:hypothetical protein
MKRFTLASLFPKKKRKTKKRTTKQMREAKKYKKLSKVQCNDTGTDCIWDDKVTVFD